MLYLNLFFLLFIFYYQFLGYIISYLQIIHFHGLNAVPIDCNHIHLFDLCSFLVCQKYSTGWWRKSTDDVCRPQYVQFTNQARYCFNLHAVNSPPLTWIGLNLITH